MPNDRLITWCNRLIKIGFFLIFALVPLLLTPINYELFEYNKMMGVYAITAVITSAWLVKMIKQREIRIAKTPLDIPIALFVASQLLSSLFSIDPHVSWLGYYSRFNGGMWSVISYVLLYYAFVSNEVFPSPSLFTLLKASLVTALLVAVYGVLERLGIDKNIWVQDVQNRVFSTLGQPNWLAAYLVALSPVSLAFAWQYALSYIGAQNKQTEKKKIKDLVLTIFYTLLAILFFVVLLFTRSRSGLLGFAVADLLFWGFVLLRRPSDGSKGNQNPAVKPVVAIHVLFALIIFFNGTGTPALDRFITFNGWRDLVSKVTPFRQGSVGQAKEATASSPTYAAPALETGGTESGVIRKYVWEGAINAWRSSRKTMLIGTGTETFAFAFYQFRPVGHNQTSEWDFLYNKAHNEYLNFLATTGAFGLGSYLLFIGTFIFWFVKSQMLKLKDQIKSKAQLTKSLDFDLDLSFGLRTLSLALFAGWLSILVTNFFGFSVVITQVFLFLFPAMIFALSSGQLSTVTIKQLRLPSWTVWLPIIVSLYILIKIGSFWYADTLFAQGYRLNRAVLIARATPLLVSATSLNPGEPLFHDELAGSYASLAVASAEAKNATQAASLAQLAITESDKALATSPNNVNFWKTRTKVFYTLSALDPSLNTQAIEALKKAIVLSPNDPKIYYNLAILSGRNGEGQTAVEYLLKAKALKPDYRDVYYALNIFYTEMNNRADARAILQEYLTNIDPNDQQFKELINK